MKTKKTKVGAWSSITVIYGDILDVCVKMYVDVVKVRRYLTRKDSCGPPKDKSRWMCLNRNEPLLDDHLLGQVLLHIHITIHATTARLYVLLQVGIRTS